MMRNLFLGAMGCAALCAAAAMPVIRTSEPRLTLVTDSTVYEGMWRVMPDVAVRTPDALETALEHLRSR